MIIYRHVVFGEAEQRRVEGTLTNKIIVYHNEDLFYFSLYPPPKFFFWHGTCSLINTPSHQIILSNQVLGVHSAIRKLANQDRSIQKEIVYNVETHCQKHFYSCPCTFAYVTHPYFSFDIGKEYVLHTGDSSLASAPVLPIRVSVPSLLCVQQIFLLSLEELSLWDLVLTPHQSYLL